MNVRWTPRSSPCPRDRERVRMSSATHGSTQALSLFMTPIARRSLRFSDRQEVCQRFGDDAVAPIVAESGGCRRRSLPPRVGAPAPRWRDARIWRRAGRAPSSKPRPAFVAHDTRRRSAPRKSPRGPARVKLSWTRTREVRAQELAGAREGGVAFVEHRGESLEHVRDARCDFECDGDIGRGGAGGESGGVVEEDLV